MKVVNFKKGISGFLSATILATVISVPSAVSATENPVSNFAPNFGYSEEYDFNYAEALQKALYFYDAEKCGQGISGGRLDWRGDCHVEDYAVPLYPSQSSGQGTNMSESFISENIDALDPDRDGCINVGGGFHDAGDHVKFGLPQSYAGSTLGWGYYEFRDSYVKIGEQDHIEDILRWFNDYFMRCTFRNNDGDVVAFCYQVGEGSTDHNYWGPPELQTTARPAYFATAENPASDQCAGAAASLAVNYMNFKDTDPSYAQKSLETAKALYEFAVANRGMGTSGGFYNSSYDEDELSWAAVWLYYATGDYNYINDIVSTSEDGTYTGYMMKIIATTANTWQNIWVHSWDTVWGGVFAKLAPITNSERDWYIFRWNCEYWSGVQHENPADVVHIQPTPGGYMCLNTWGSARYNTAAQLCCLVYDKYKDEDRFVEWARGQMDYLFGKNPMGRCYEVGYSEISADYPHHRAAHGSTTNSMLTPENQRHILWGALCGGPDSADKHVDVTTDYVYNEVAIDYNAGFIGALAGLIQNYGENMQPNKNFNPNYETETAIFASAKIEQESVDRTQVTVTIHNESFLPPKYEDSLKARYYFNIKEMLDAGQSIDNITVDIMYDQSAVADAHKTGVSAPIPYDEANGIYYIELDWSGIKLHGQRDIHFALVATQDSQFKAHWDVSNDWSRQGLKPKENLKTEYIPVYSGDELVWGSEPVIIEPEISCEVSSPESGSSFDFKAEASPIKITADAAVNGDMIKKVEFYANGAKIGEDSSMPYETEFTPSSVGMTTDGVKKINITAKVVTVLGFTKESTPVETTVYFPAFEGTELCIVNPADNAILDTTAGNFTTQISANILGNSDDITKVIIFANDVVVAESDSNICTGTYTAPDMKVSSPDGIVDVKLTAKATKTDGTVISADPVTLKVKYEVSDTGYDGLTFSNLAVGKTAPNTIAKSFSFTNNGYYGIDLSKVTLRYYYNSDNTGVQNFTCDSSGMYLNEKPFFVSTTNEISGTCKDTENISNADKYVELSFEKIPYKLAVDKSLTVSFRITNEKWTDFDKANDYSENNPDGIVVLYNGYVISGVMPE